MVYRGLFSEAVCCQKVESKETSAPAETTMTALEYSGDVIEIPSGFQLEKAFYGHPDKVFDFKQGVDVTAKAKELLSQGIKLEANNELFGDPLPGLQKALVIQVSKCAAPVITTTDVVSLIAREHTEEVITLPTGKQVKRAFFGNPAHPWDLSQGADVTEKVQLLLAEGAVVKPSIELLGDPCFGVGKELIVEVIAAASVSSNTLMEYEYSGNSIQIPSGWVITRAFYGNPEKLWQVGEGADVTEEVRELFAQGNRIEASNDLLGDPLPGVYKALVLEIHPQQEEKVRTTNTRKHVFKTLERSEEELLIPSDLEIKRAFYGHPERPFDPEFGADVTHLAKQIRAAGGKLEASNEVFGDSLPGYGKELIIETVLSLYAYENSEDAIVVPSGYEVTAAFYGNPEAPWGAEGDVTERVRELLAAQGTLQASNDLFGDTCYGVGKILLVEASPMSEL
eukprot:gb/GEZN01007958.1/.p1 GENE.gb/GEZN01007958.1/~~gb/GEZN01007958.1/.p1  ORF type:complete len:453 (-),score=91.26 gb/GEZN01007958.1/:94-1452(-)